MAVNIFDKKARAAAMTFPGVVVESKEVEFDGVKKWSMTLYNKNINQFLRANVVNLVGPDSPGWVASSLRKRMDWWDAQGVDADSYEDYEGYEMQFDTIVDETKFGPSIKYKPTKKLGRVSTTVLAEYKAKLVDLRNNRGKTTPAQEVATTAGEDLSAEDEAALLAIYVGRTDDEAQEEAARQLLPPKLIRMMLSGQAAQVLMERGRLDVNAETWKYVVGGE